MLAALVVAVPAVRFVADTSAGGVSLVGRSSASASAPETDTGAGTADADEARLLATMTRAVKAGDARAFTAVAAPGATAVREHLRQMFTGLRALPLGAVRLTVDRNRSVGVPVEGRVSGATALPVRLSYQLRGWDDTPVQVPMQFTVVRVGGGLRVVEDRTATDDETNRRLEPWMFPGLHVTTTKHVLVMGERADAAQLRRLAATLERLVGDVRKVWPERTWNGRVVVYATTRTAFVRSWYGRTAAGDGGNGDRASFVAKVATMSRPGGLGPGAVRMVVTPYLLRSERPGYVDILRHEMTHVATARLSPAVPVWIVEGAAEYTGFARRTASGRLDALTTFGRHGLTQAEITGTLRGTWRPTLKPGPEFYRGSGKAVDEAYNSAFITCLYIADTYGEKTLRRLYSESVRLAGPYATFGPALLPTTEKKLLKQVLRTDRKRLAKDVGAYATRLRSQLVFR